MKTPDENEFPELRRLLSLKRHEQPPPGYFETLPRSIAASLRHSGHARRSADRPEHVPGWILGILDRLQARPVLATLAGTAFCGLLLAGLLNHEQDVQRIEPMPSLLTVSSEAQPAAGDAPATGVAFTPVAAHEMPLLASNQWQTPSGPSLFDLAPSLQVAPVSGQP